MEANWGFAKGVYVGFGGRFSEGSTTGVSNNIGVLFGNYPDYKANKRNIG